MTTIGCQDFLSEGRTSATFLKNAGIPVFIDDKHAIVHDKIMVIDRRTVITGSFNFTKAAQVRNAENLLVAKGNKAVVEKYLGNYATRGGGRRLSGKSGNGGAE